MKIRLILRSSTNININMNNTNTARTNTKTNTNTTNTSTTNTTNNTKTNIFCAERRESISCLEKTRTERGAENVEKLRARVDSEIDTLCTFGIRLNNCFRM